MKNTKTLLGIVAVFLLLFGIYKLSTFAIFDEEFKEIEAISIPNKNYTIKIYHIPSNASSQSYIQIRKSENGVEEVLQNYDRYDHINGYSIRKDTLKLKLGNSILSKQEEKIFLLP